MTHIWIDHNILEKVPGVIKVGRMLLANSSQIQLTLTAQGDGVYILGGFPYTGTETFTGITGLTTTGTDTGTLTSITGTGTGTLTPITGTGGSWPTSATGFTSITPATTGTGGSWPTSATGFTSITPITCVTSMTPCPCSLPSLTSCTCLTSVTPCTSTPPTCVTSITWCTCPTTATICTCLTSVTPCNPPCTGPVDFTEFTVVDANNRLVITPSSISSTDLRTIAYNYCDGGTAFYGLEIIMRAETSADFSANESGDGSYMSISNAPDEVQTDSAGALSVVSSGIGSGEHNFRMFFGEGQEQSIDPSYTHGEIFFLEMTRIDTETARCEVFTDPSFAFLIDSMDITEAAMTGIRMRYLHGLSATSAPDVDSIMSITDLNVIQWTE